MEVAEWAAPLTEERDNAVMTAYLRSINGAFTRHATIEEAGEATIAAIDSRLHQATSTFVRDARYVKRAFASGDVKAATREHEEWYGSLGSSGDATMHVRVIEDVNGNLWAEVAAEAATIDDMDAEPDAHATRCLDSTSAGSVRSRRLTRRDPSEPSGVHAARSGRSMPPTVTPAAASTRASPAP